MVARQNPGFAHGLPFAGVGPAECSRVRGADRATDEGNDRGGFRPGIITAGREVGWPRVTSVSSHGVRRMGPTGKTTGSPGCKHRSGPSPGAKGPRHEPVFR